MRATSRDITKSGNVEIKIAAFIWLLSLDMDSLIKPKEGASVSEELFLFTWSPEV